MGGEPTRVVRVCLKPRRRDAAPRAANSFKGLSSAAASCNGVAER
jgi:hypothetical protein